MSTIKRIGIFSAFRVGAMLTTMLWVALGGVLGVLLACAVLTSSVSSPSGSEPVGGGVDDVVTILVIYVVGIVAAAFVGGIVASIYAVLYNATTRRVGRLRAEVE